MHRFITSTCNTYDPCTCTARSNKYMRHNTNRSAICAAQSASRTAHQAHPAHTRSNARATYVCTHTPRLCIHDCGMRVPFEFTPKALCTTEHYSPPSAMCTASRKHDIPYGDATHALQRTAVVGWYVRSQLYFQIYFLSRVICRQS